MKVHRAISQPIRTGLNWLETWNGDDMGLIACWERGRSKRLEDPLLASQADRGQLVTLPWKGGVKAQSEGKHKRLGSLFYLAMWQGLRGEDLSIDTSVETFLTCSVEGITVRFTSTGDENADQ